MVNLFFLKRRAQITIFVIIGITIFLAIILFFIVRQNLANRGVPEEIKPAYNYYLSCVEEGAREGISLLGFRGGYIYLPNFEPGSSYRPFSNQLDFLGQAVPYWMYVSRNNILVEQVPTKQKMQEDLNKYISEKVSLCDFSDMAKQGFDIFIDSPRVDSKINDNNVEVSIKNKVYLFYKGKSLMIENHNLKINSKIGKFYNIARDIYSKQKERAFLEDYAIDVMMLYAPVDGVEITCEPKIFYDEEIKKNIKDALVANIGSIKLKGSYYSSSKKNDYFVRDIGKEIDEGVNFVYMDSFPTKIEIYGDRVVRPVGLESGMGVLGFCYVPYHLVYDIDFPVLVQIFDESEVFQFPISVLISRNQKRKGVSGDFNIVAEDRVCEFKNQQVSVYSYDNYMNPVEVDLRFRCLDSICDIGKTKISNGSAVFIGGFPQCVNGHIIASAEGYADTKYRISTNEENFAHIVMLKKHKIKIDLGSVSKALVYFDSPDYSTTILYPETKEIELVEGYYNISVYVYENSSLVIPEKNERKCFEVPQSGLSGILGATKNVCHDIKIPSINVDFAVVGGGRTSEFISSNDLEKYSKLNINVPLFERPKSFEDLQRNYELATEESIYVDFV